MSIPEVSLGDGKELAELLHLSEVLEKKIYSSSYSPDQEIYQGASLAINKRTADLKQKIKILDESKSPTHKK